VGCGGGVATQASRLSPDKQHAVATRETDHPGPAAGEALEAGFRLEQVPAGLAHQVVDGQGGASPGPGPGASSQPETSHCRVRARQGVSASQSMRPAGPA